MCLLVRQRVASERVGARDGDGQLLEGVVTLHEEEEDFAPL